MFVAAMEGWKRKGNLVYVGQDGKLYKESDIIASNNIGQDGDILIKERFNKIRLAQLASFDDILDILNDDELALRINPSFTEEAALYYYDLGKANVTNRTINTWIRDLPALNGLLNKKNKTADDRQQINQFPISNWVAAAIKEWNKANTQVRTKEPRQVIKRRTFDNKGNVVFEEEDESEAYFVPIRDVSKPKRVGLSSRKSRSRMRYDDEDDIDADLIDDESNDDSTNQAGSPNRLGQRKGYGSEQTQGQKRLNILRRARRN